MKNEENPKIKKVGVSEPSLNRLKKLTTTAKFPIQNLEMLFSIAIERFTKHYERIFNDDVVSDVRKTEARKELQNEARDLIESGTLSDNMTKWDRD